MPPRIPRRKDRHSSLPTRMKLEATVGEMPVNHRARHMDASKCGDGELAVAGARWPRDRHFGDEIREKNR